MVERSRFLKRWLLAACMATSVALGGCCELGLGDDCDDPMVPQEVTGSATLSVTPIAQQTAVWCWAATAEMVFRHYGLPSLNSASYQCGIVAAYFGGPCSLNCGLCVSPISGMSELNRLLQLYGPTAQQLGLPSPTLRTRLSFRPLELREIAAEIDNNRPIVAGISAGGFPFPNFSNHVVVIVGYDADGPEARLLVNDPFPYDLPQFSATASGNPYLSLGGALNRPGQYWIAYDAFRGPMAWGNTIDRISR